MDGQPIKAPLSFGANCQGKLQELYDNDWLVVHCEKPFRGYLGFDNVEHFFDYSNTQEPQDRCYHEVIIGNGPRNLYVDIDSYDITPNDFPVVGNEVVRTFHATACEYFAHDINPRDVMVISACGYSDLKASNKFSLHLRVNTISTTPRDMADFATYFSKRLTRPEIVDLGVYKEFQCVRILGNTKAGEFRPSKVLYPNGVADEGALDALKRSMIGFRPCIGQSFEPVQPPQIEQHVQQVNVDDELVKFVLENTREHWVGYSFRARRGNRVYFTRMTEAHCEICERSHDNDNGLYFIIQADHVTKSCFRDASKSRRRILELPNDRTQPVVEAPAAPKITPQQRLEKLMAAAVVDDKLKTGVFENLVRIAYNEPVMRPYDTENANTIIIQAQKGVGKTEQLVRCIQEKYHGKTILALSHRETFSAELCRQLPGFTNYKDIKGPINPLIHPRVVVQIESLSRVDLNELRHHELCVDLLIMDESESIIEQLNSGLDRKFAQSWDVFNWLTLYSEQVIAMDANITNRTLIALSPRKANQVGQTQCSFVQNTFKKVADTEYKFTIDEQQWRAALFKDLEAGLNVFIPINSATEALALERDVRKMFPDKKVKCYTGATDQKEKRQDIENIDDAWTCEVLIFTPTITSGVSYKMENFNKTYAWFKHNSCTVLACDQMMGRVRDISTRQVVVLLDHKRSESWTTFNKLRAAILNSRNNLFATFAPSWLTYETTPNGIDVHNKRYFDIMLSNEVAKNHSRSDFMGEFVRLVKRSGAKVSALGFAEIAPAAEVIHKESLGDVKLARVNTIIETPDITAEEYAELGVKAEKTPEETQKMHRRYLRDVYKYDGVIDSFFVENYDSPQAINWFRSLQTARGKTLAEIQTAEREHYLEKHENVNNLNKTYYFEHHRIAQSALTALGFTGLTDESTHSGEELTAAINTHKQTFIAGYELARDTLRFKSKKPTFANLKSSLEYLNSILYAVYGVKIAGKWTKKAGTSDYKINHKHPFDQTNFQPLEIAKDVQHAEKNNEVNNELTVEDFRDIETFIKSL